LVKGRSVLVEVERREQDWGIKFCSGQKTTQKHTCDDSQNSSPKTGIVLRKAAVSRTKSRQHRATGGCAAMAPGGALSATVRRMLATSLRAWRMKAVARGWVRNA
jgi:hypothetical protein